MATQAQRPLNGSTVARKSGDSLLNAYTIMILSWMGDFKAESAGSGAAIQGAYLFVYLAGLMWYALAYQGTKLRVPGTTRLVYAASLFLVVGVTGAIVRGLDGYATFRNSIGTVIYAISAVTTAQVILNVELLRLRKRFDLPPSEWPNFYFRIGQEGGMEWQGSTSRRRSSPSCVKRRLCWRRAARWQMRVAGSASPSRATTAGARNMAV